MKRILFFLILLCLEKTLHAQTPRSPYIYTIKADSVKITNTCDTAELIIENHTQTVPGFLFNKGRGRTEFRRITQYDDTTVVIGGDTIHLGRGYKNFANADLTFTGNRIHNGAFRAMSLTDFNKIGFKSNTTDGLRSTEMSMDSRRGYNLIMTNSSNPDLVKTTTQTADDHSTYTEIAATTGDFAKYLQMVGSERLFSIMVGDHATDGSYGTSAGINIGVMTDTDPREVDIYSQDGTMHIYTANAANKTRIEMNFNKGDYLTTTCSKYDVGGSGVSQTPTGFTFSAAGLLGFKLPGLPISTNSQDSVLVISDSGQVKKQAQSSLTPALNIITGDIVDITAQVDAVTKLPNLQSHAGHSVSLPAAASYTGKKIYIWNQNASVNVWTFSSSITLPDGSTSNAIPNQSTIELLSDGNVWIKWK
jgi:hypothetical protein